jgi:hypothetical protein
MKVYIWIREKDLESLNKALKDRDLLFTKEERIHIFNEKIFPQSVLISVSYDDYISLDDRNIIRKIY